MVFSRLSEPANYRDSADDPPDPSGALAEVPCNAGDADLAASTPDLGQVAEAGTGRPA